MALLLFPVLGIVTGLLVVRTTGSEGEDALLDVVAAAIGSVAGGWEALALAGMTRPGLLAATAAGLGGAMLLLGVVRLLADRLVIEA
jgi:uncharacterized membrane protein YeaQ/YmgE (transglycosylase-associated protein family)